LLSRSQGGPPFNSSLLVCRPVVCEVFNSGGKHLGTVSGNVFFFPALVGSDAFFFFFDFFFFFFFLFFFFFDLLFAPTLSDDAFWNFSSITNLDCRRRLLIYNDWS